jgi:hypothetical protein
LQTGSWPPEDPRHQRSRDQPPPQEREAGFTSSVPEELRATEPDAADPERLVRLNQHPEELTAVAKAQIVCTFANFQALSDGTVVTLGGPAADERRTWREYTCATSLRHLPEAVHTIGLVVPAREPTTPLIAALVAEAKALARAALASPSADSSSSDRARTWSAS